MQNWCICDEFSPFDAFKCSICGKTHHWRCYDYEITDKQPPKMRCIVCRLAAYDPFLKIFELARIPLSSTAVAKRGFYLRAGSLYRSQAIHFQVTPKHFELIKQKRLRLILAAPRLKESQSKRLFEWASMNLYLLLNGKHHLTYQESHYIQIPASTLESREFTIQVSLKEPMEFTGLLIVGVAQEQTTGLIRAQLFEIKPDLQQLVDGQKQSYMDRLNKIRAENEADDLKQEERVIVRLVDGFSLQPIEIPVKGKDCLHMDCFDLMVFLEMNVQPTAARWKCPTCKQLAPLDRLMIDYVQLEIIHRLKVNYPQFCHLVQRVSLSGRLLDMHFLDEHLLALEKKYALPLADMIGVRRKNFESQAARYPQLVHFVKEYLENCDTPLQFITLKHARKLIKNLNSKKLFQNVAHNHFQILEFFVQLFDCSKYLDTSIFQHMEHVQAIGCLELVCRMVSHHTTSGLFAYFLKLLSKSVQEQSKAMLLLIFDRNFKYEKLLELILASSYMHSQGASPGATLREILYFLYKEKDQRESHLKQVAHLFPQVFYGFDMSNQFIVKNCQCVADMISIYELDFLKALYPLELIQKQPQQKFRLTLIIYIINGKIQRQRKNAFLFLDKNPFEKGFDQLLSDQFAQYQLDKRAVQGLDGIDSYIYF